MVYTVKIIIITKLILFQSECSIFIDFFLEWFLLIPWFIFGQTYLCQVSICQTSIVRKFLSNHFIDVKCKSGSDHRTRVNFQWCLYWSAVTIVHAGTARSIRVSRLTILNWKAAWSRRWLHRYGVTSLCISDESDNGRRLVNIISKQHLIIFIDRGDAWRQRRRRRNAVINQCYTFN